MRVHGLRARVTAPLVALMVLAGTGTTLLVTSASPAAAATFTVINTHDNGAGSLRQAITDAAVTGGEVDVQAGLGTITLTTGVINPSTWGGAVVVKGNGVTVDGGGSTSGVIERRVGSTGDLSIDGMTITHSSPTGAAVAAVIAEGTGALNLSNCVISHNHATIDGVGAGAVYSNTGDATAITGCVIGPDNTATGLSALAGGVTSEGGDSGSGGLTITGSSIIGNTGTSTGAQDDVAGGVFNNGSSVTVVNSSITGNTASGRQVVAGAINNEGGPATTKNSTISGNTANLLVGSASASSTGTTIPPRHAGSGDPNATATTLFISGGIANLGGVETLTYVTLDNNTDSATGVSQFAAANYLNAGGTVTFFATAVGSPVGGTSCVADNVAFASAGYNAEDDAGASCGFSTSTHDLVGQALGLGALGDNGGPGPTLLPQTGSPLIDHVPTTSCKAGSAAGITTDERGIPRPQGPGCDTGAVEVVVTAPVPPPVPTPVPTPPTPAPAVVPAPVVLKPAFTG